MPFWGGSFKISTVETLLEFIHAHVAEAPYLIFGLLLLAGFGLPVSEDVMLLASALLAAKHPDQLAPLFTGVFLGAYFSDLICYAFLGRYLGNKVFQIRFFSKLVKQKRIEKVGRFYQKYGVIVLLVGRFIPFGVRNALFFTAGLSKMNVWKFALTDLLACLLSCSAYFAVYYTFGENAVEMIQKGNRALLLLLPLALLVCWFYCRRKKMYQVSATSSLILLWTDQRIYESVSAKKFFQNINLDAGKGLKDQLTDIPHIKEEITNRKYGVKKFCDQFLSTCEDAQVVFLGSGIDPKSIDVAELYPKTSVFDVDMDNMQAKTDINKKIAGPSNIAFCQADVSNAREVVDTLSQHGYKKDRPTLVVAEGITYYISKELFRETLKALRTDKGGAAIEYSLPNEALTHPEMAVHYKNNFENVRSLLKWPTPLCRYTTQEISQLADFSGGQLSQTLNQQEIERERTGGNRHYQDHTGCIYISLILY